MDVNRHVIASILLHSLFITAAFTAAGRGTAIRVPPVIVSVSLVEDNTVPSPAGLPEAKQPIRTETTDGAARPAAPAVSGPAAPQLNKDDPHVRNRVEKPGKEAEQPLTDGGNGAAPGEGFPAATQGLSTGAFFGGSWVPGIEAGGTKGAGATGRGEVTGKGGSEAPGGSGSGHADALAIIRAAIERAKSYPPMAKRRGMEGTATVSFRINGKGTPERIRITKSSGSDILDAAARETISRAAPFPAIRADIEVPITYRLNREE